MPSMLVALCISKEDNVLTTSSSIESMATVVWGR